MAQIEIDGVTVTFGEGAQRRYATLTWTDPNTNAAFHIRGPLDKEALIEIAERVRRIQ